ncbi:MAG TPA: VOC family protein [Alphaproteobacteria bacterium]
MAQTEPMKMVAPMEVGIAVRDLDQMREFYTRVLGFEEISTVQVPSDKTAASAMATDGATVVRVQTPYGERIKLLSAPSTNATERPHWLLERAGLAYLTFIVRDIAAEHRRLRAAGVQLMSDGPIENRPGLRVLFFRDPEGNTLELVEYADLGSYRPDLAHGA